MKKLQYTGLNYFQVKELVGDRVMDPYFCMGFSMISILTKDGFVNVNEGQTIVIDDNGDLSIED